jgi:Double zinc ribbon
MKCSRCHGDNDEGARFCEDCGARLELLCPRCGVWRAGWRATLTRSTTPRV